MPKVLQYVGLQQLSAGLMSLMFDPLVGCIRRRTAQSASSRDSWSVSPDSMTFTFHIDPRAPAGAMAEA